MPVKRSRRSRKFGTNKGSTQGKMNQFKRSFGRSFVSYFPGPTSSNTHLLGALLLVFILRVGMKGFNKENIEQQIKNSEYLLVVVSIIIDRLKYGVKSGTGQDRRLEINKNK